MDNRNKKWIVLLTVVCVALSTFVYADPAEQALKLDLKLGAFGAFYTKINSGEDFEAYSRTGDYADIVVDLGKDGAALVFWRGSSYLPFLQVGDKRWYVSEVVKRKGDGAGRMHDRVNAFSVVKIIEDGPDQVLIHWRYLPEFTEGNPQGGLSPCKFVDEYFAIKPDGSVLRTIRHGTEKLEEWRIDGNVITETFSLSVEGIKNVHLTDPATRRPVLPKVKGSPLVSDFVVKPSAWWKFDEGQGDETKETISLTRAEIFGDKSLWRQGVSGTAIQFDGYNTVLELAPEHGPTLDDDLSLEAWVALGAYPWNRVPIIQQLDDTAEAKGGYFLGIDAYGKPVFRLHVGGKWEELIGNKVLERRRWYQLVASYDRANGLMKLYVDGQLLDKRPVARAGINVPETSVKLGKGKAQFPINGSRKNKVSYALDGLMDEVKVYDVALSAEQVAQAYQLLAKNKTDYAAVDMDQRILPEGENRSEFGAYYTHLKFYDIWDNLWRFGKHPDIVVEFDDSPAKFIFWRGVSYIPMLVNDQEQWYSNEFNETWNKSGGVACQEPMSDKGPYYTHARIVENTPARTVIHWRYPLLDVNYVMANYDAKTGWCDWSDWYYYIYPDGMAVKRMRLWTHGQRNHEWHESMVIFGPDQHPEEIIHTQDALMMMNLSGDIKRYNWKKGPPPNIKEPAESVIQQINYKAEYKPLTIGRFMGSRAYGGELTNYSVFPSWNHWPIAQINCFSRKAIYSDRTACSSLTHLFLKDYRSVKDGPKPFQERLLMEGMLKQKPEEILPLAKSWLSFPKLSQMQGLRGAYDPSQRAYVLDREAEKMSFSIEASEENPVYNVALVIKDWGGQAKARVKVNGKWLRSGSSLRQGIVRDTDGSSTLVLWIAKKTSKTMNIEIE